MKCVFLDRDGVINKDLGYVHKLDDFKYLDGAIEGLKKLSNSDFLIIVLTNQSGIARGFYTEKDLDKLHMHMALDLKKKDIYIDEIFYCPHHINGSVKKYAIDCNCRKPKTGMIDMALRKYPIDMNKSYMVGDKDTDLETGKKAGVLKSFKVSDKMNLNMIAEIILKK